MFKHNKPVEQPKNESSFINGALFGAIIGAALGVLYSPGKGEEIRRKLKSEADKFMDKAEPAVKDAIKKSKPIIAKVKVESEPFIEEAKQKINEALEDVGDELDKLKKQSKKKKSSFFN
jgi:gas vesicle protein